MNHWTQPRRCEVEPYELNDMQRQAADERAARNNPGAWLDARQHGTEGCADTGDEPGQWPEGGFIACMLVFGCVAVALIGAYVQWGAK